MLPSASLELLPVKFTARGAGPLAGSPLAEAVGAWFGAVTVIVVLALSVAPSSSVTTSVAV